MVVEILELGTLTSKAVASLSGLVPFARESGIWKGSRFIGGGRKFLREALYMPAHAAIRFNLDRKAKYQQLKQAQKPSKVANVCDQLLTVIDAPDLVKPINNACEQTVDMSLLAGHFHYPPIFGVKEMIMNKDQREIQRKLRILRHADVFGHEAITC